MSTTERPTGRAVTHGTYTLPRGDMTAVVEGLMEAQVRMESAGRISNEPVVAEHLAFAFEEMRIAQQLLSGAQFVPAWDGVTDRRLG